MPISNPLRATAAATFTLAALAALLALAPLDTRAAERAIDKAVVVAAAVEQVWASWTTRTGITAFLAPEAVIDPRPDGAFEIRFDPLAEPGQRGADGMRYLALQPPSMLSFTWNAPPHLPAARSQRTVVIVRLAPIEGGRTQVTLHHTGWGDGGEWDEAYRYFDRVWSGVLEALRQRHETGQARDWTAWMEQLRKMHAAPAAPATR